MASCPTPKRAKCSVRHHLQLSFPSQGTKEAFLARLDRAKQRMFPEGGTVDNYRLLTGLLGALEGQAVGDEAQTEGFGTPESTPRNELTRETKRHESTNKSSRVRQNERS